VVTQTESVRVMDEGMIYFQQFIYDYIKESVKREM